MTTKFEYLLNAMENAAAQDSPSAHGYAGKRQMVLQYAADLEARVEYPSSPQVSDMPDEKTLPRHVMWAELKRRRLAEDPKYFGPEVKPRTGDKVCHCGLSESAHCIGGGAEHDFRENPVEYPSPISVNLACPECGAPHIDEGEWATRPHKTHQCQSCKHEWRPFEYPTVGVDPEAEPRTGEGS